MMRVCTAAACVLALLAGTPSAGGLEGPEAQEGWQAEYAILVERNIFARDRGRAERQEAARARREAPPPQRYLFLRGVARLNGEYVAFLEEMRSGEVSRARSGDEVLEGWLGEVTLDSIEYVKDGEAARIGIGENLQQASGPTGGDETTAQAAESPAEAGAADILERLRKRRQGELGQ